MRVVEDRVKTLRAALAELDEQIVSTERALADVKAQRDRDTAADAIEAMATAIEQAAPKFDAGAAALVDAVAKGRGLDPGGDGVFCQCRGDAPRGSLGGGLDLLGAAIRRGAYPRGQRQCGF